MRLCALRLSAVNDAALEAFRLVGADREDLRTGIMGGKSIVRWEFADDPADSDIVRRLRFGKSKYPTSLALENCAGAVEFRDMLLLVSRLLVDLRDGVRADFIEDRRSGTTTTGMLPSFQSCLLDLTLGEVLVAVAVELRPWRSRLKIPERL
jgi:hypothetical protein